MSVSLLAAGCSKGPDLSADEREAALSNVAEVSALAGISISDQDSSCVVDRLTTEEVASLAEVDRTDNNAVITDGVLSERIADSVVECVGKENLLRPALVVAVGGGSEESLGCMVEEFDEALLRDLISSKFEDKADIPLEVEIEVGLVAGACLTAEELLQLHID